MVELSLKEQKQINGGNSLLTVTNKATGEIVHQEIFYTLREAMRCGERYDYNKYRIAISEC